MQSIEKDLKKIKNEFEKIAMENITIETTSDFIYFFGTELAILRIFQKYSKSNSFNYGGYSNNLKTFYGTIERF